MKITEGPASLSPDPERRGQVSSSLASEPNPDDFKTLQDYAEAMLARRATAIPVQGESAEAHALEFLKEFCGLHESGVVGDSITVLHTHKGSESGYWVIDSEGNKRRWKEILAIYAQRVNAELSAANSDLMAQLAELQKQQTNLACMSIENLISSGNQNVRSLQERAEKSEAMLADAQRNRI